MSNAAAREGKDGLVVASGALAVMSLVVLINLFGGMDRGGPAPTPQPATADLSEATQYEAAPAPPTYATSFDCAGAQSWDERLICGNAELAAKDRQLGTLYDARLASAGPEEQRALRSEQRVWLRQRTDCSSAPDGIRCVSELFDSQMSVLQQGTLQSPAIEEPEPLAIASEVRRPARGLETRPAPQAPTRAVLCVLPSGEELRIGDDACRQRAGVIFE